MQQLTTLNEVNDYLSELSVDANSSLKSALQAQMQVVKYVQSPELYDSTFDLFFQNIKQSIRYAESVETKEAIRQQATLMIQNYVFFLNAKLQYNIQVNRENGYKLMAEACEMLSENIIALAMIAASGSTSVGSAGVELAFSVLSTTLKNKMHPNEEQKDGFFSKAVRWATSVHREQQERNDFLRTMDLLVHKLYKQRFLIGKSDLISGLIKRYAEELTDYHRDRDYNEKKKDDVNEKYSIVLFFLGICGALSVVARIVYRLVRYSNIGFNSWFLNHFFVVIAVIGLLGIVYLIHMSIYKIRWNALFKKYKEMARAFDEDE